MNDVRVIAVGSPFVGDNIAWQVSDILQQHFSSRTEQDHTIEFVKLDRPGSQLLDHLQNTEMAIIIDALQDDVAGGVIELTMPQLQEENNRSSSHGFGVADALQLAAAMQSLPEKLRIFGLSPVVDTQTLVVRCLALLQQSIADGSIHQEGLNAV